MTLSEREKMIAGEWYTCIDPELERLRAQAHEAIHEHNTMSPCQRGSIGPALAELLGRYVSVVPLNSPASSK